MSTVARAVRGRQGLPGGAPQNRTCNGTGIGEGGIDEVPEEPGQRANITTHQLQRMLRSLSKEGQHARDFSVGRE
eukprot:scaffold3619_cov328-Prasinococcus_capsulatus_cf.AAC.7